jgi:hypothetical protein
MSPAELGIFLGVLPIVLGLVGAGVAIIVKDQRRKRRGEPRPHQVWEAQRKERIEAERALVEKHNPTPPKQRPQPPQRPGNTQRPQPPQRPEN